MSRRTQKPAVVTVSERDPFLCAVHEAGHAVVACKLRVPFKYVTIEQEDSSAGHVEMTVSYTHVYRDFVRRGAARVPDPWRENRIMVSYAGISAEELKFWSADLARADDSAFVDFVGIKALASGTPQISESRLLELREKTRRLVRRPEVRFWIERVAHTLCACETIDARAVKMLKDGRCGPSVDGEKWVIWGDGGEELSYPFPPRRRDMTIPVSL
jgi:hypothetical protein